MAQSPEANATNNEVIRYDLGWNAINAMLRAGRSLSGHERNCCFLGTESGRFADISGVAGLDLADDGRVLALADWDYDGDVDFWVANRSGPQVRYLQNNIMNGSGESATNFIAIQLQGVDCNRDAIGARVMVKVDDKTQCQTLNAGDGYLSQSSKWLHFGVGDKSKIDEVTITWPAGENSKTRTQKITNVDVNKRYLIQQGEEPLEWLPRLQARALTASNLVAPPVSDRARISLLNPVPLPEIACADASGQMVSLTHGDLGPRLVNLWASWCQPCLAELTEWQKRQSDFDNAGLSIVLVNVDSGEAQSSDAASWLKQARLPFRNFNANEEIAARFDVIQRALLSRQRPLPIPSSFLIDADGQLRAVYKGPVPAPIVLRDVQLLSADRDMLLAAATPFQGKWHTPPGGSTPLQLAVKLIEGGHSDQAQDYITTLIEKNSPQLTASLLNLRAAVLTDKKEFRKAVAAYTQSLKLDPNNRQAHIELGSLMLGARQGAAAEKHFLTVLKASPNDPDLNFRLGMSYLVQQKIDQAATQMQRVIQLRPLPLAYWHLADIAIVRKKPSLAIQNYEQALKLAPQLIDKANNLAWLLATIDNVDARDGKRAIEIAESYCLALEAPTPQSLDTLAAAYASASQFEKAVTTAKRAIDLAEKTGDNSLLADIRNRLALYQQKKPFVESL